MAQIGEGGAMAQITGESSEGTLWSRILASTDRNSARGPGATGRAGSSRRIVVLGNHHSGKSTVIKAIARSDSSHRPGGSTSSRRDKGKAVAKHEGDSPDLGINFEYIDIADDGESGEDASSRLSVYQVPPMDNALHTTLLPLALTPESLLDSLVIIVLDWEKPWTFIRDLKGWFEALSQVVADIENGTGEVSHDPQRRKGKDVVEEARELLEAYVRSYHEPKPKDTSSVTASAVHPLATATDSRSPLPAGTLQVNLGCNIVVVCNKSDCIQALERGAQLNEETIEYIQQALRTICLQYGAALFFTSQYHPSTLARLRAYVLHRIQSMTSLQASHGSTQSDPDETTTAAALVGSTSRHPFPYRANAVDREQICIPTGWDSFGKIRVLREGFDCIATARGWQLDLGAKIEDDDNESKPATSTVSTYEGIVIDVELLRNPYANTGGYMEVQNEQDFLRAHHDMLAREAAKARHQHQQAVAAGKGPPGTSTPDITDVAKKFFGSVGVVGPMASSGLSLPTVEKALERETTPAFADTGNTRRGTVDRREPGRPPSSSSNGHVLSPPLPNHSTSPPLPNSPTPSSGGTQNEVLANFFQSLLADRKDRVGKGSNGPTSAGGAPNRNSVDLSKSTGRRT